MSRTARPLPRPLRARGVLTRSDRPLTKPEHYTRFLGRRARVRLRDDGRATANASLTGELVGASEQEVTIAAGDGVVTIPYERIARSNLVPGD